MEGLIVFDMVMRTAAALLFLEAAAAKLSDLPAFEGVTANYRILPEPLVRPVALGLPLAELLVAATLLAAPLAPWPQAAAAILLGLFAAAMALNLARGRAFIDCGCGRGAAAQPLSWPRVARNLVLGAGLLVGAVLPSPAPSSPPPWPAWLIGLAGGAGLFCLDYALSYLGALSQRGTERRA